MSMRKMRMKDKVCAACVVALLPAMYWSCKTGSLAVMLLCSTVMAVMLWKVRDFT